MGAYASEWRRLYSFARLTIGRNPSLPDAVLCGQIKPHYGLMMFIDEHYSDIQESLYR